jgi:hypothetical protein
MGGAEGAGPPHAIRYVNPVFRRRAYYATFADKEIETIAYEGPERVGKGKVTITVASVWEDNDRNPEMMITGAPRQKLVWAGQNPNHMVAAIPYLSTLSSTQLNALAIAAHDKGFSELEYEIMVEEGRRSLAKKDEEKKKKAK